MKPAIWHATIGLALIAIFFSIVGAIAYILYGPGITVIVPDFFGLGKATSTDSTSSRDFLDGQDGALYKCDEEKALKAEILDRGVRLLLSDGRQISLPQTVAASGTRYANTNESFIFHTKGSSAFVEENGATTYVNCTDSTPN